MKAAVQPIDSLVQAFCAVRAHSEALAAPLSAEDCSVQSMPDASPVKWHLAHTSWFFETVILSKQAGYKPFDPRFAFLFNSYYEALGPRHPRPRRGLLTRPSLEEVYAYRAHVDAAIAQACKNPEWENAITLGLHHEQQHQELILTDIKHAFFSNPLLPAYHNRPAEPGQPQKLEWREHQGGVALIGHDPKNPNFAFDNESPRHQVLLRPFRIASRPVSNGEYQAFIADGGYRRPEFWLSDGWAKVQEEKWEAPLYWLAEGNKNEQVFTLSGVQPLDPHAAIEHVSFYEAAAYAAWAKARLPTEFEWEASAAQFDHGPQSSMGQVWEWTRSAYDPYPGFKPLEGAVSEYNGKFMVGQMVLRGGSSATPRGHMRPTYRNFFPPASRWQFSGIRLAEDM